MDSKELITQALKESREGEGTLTLKDISEILMEVFEPDELYQLILFLENYENI